MKVLSSREEREDNTCGLPYSIMHRIMSFWPLTEKTDYYKTWPHQWTDVLILSFVPNEKLFVDSEDFPLIYLDPRLALWICFAVKRDVKELILYYGVSPVEVKKQYSLPQFLFNNSSLVSMKLSVCYFNPSRKVNWESLKSLSLNNCELDDQVNENVICGSPLLECLELISCGFEEGVVIASKHMKTFVVEEFGGSMV